MSETETRAGLTSRESLSRWTNLCGACDAGLAMGCTCPEGDHRAVILALWRERDAARAELSRLRVVVEAVQALADEWAGYEWPGPMGVQIQRVQAHTWEAATREHAAALRRALAPVSSSGEAESGEALVVPAGADLDCVTAGCRWGDPSSDRCECRLTPNVVSAVLEAYHPDGVVLWLAQWASGKGNRARMVAGVLAEWSGEPAERVLAYVSATGDGLYEVTPDGAPLYGRDLESVAKAALAARPVLSREALTAAILGARDGGGNLVEYLSASTAGVLADAILAAEAGAR